MLSDTEDLSTIRGSGLAVLHLEEIVCDIVAALLSIPADTLTPVTKGASQLVLKIDTDNPDDFCDGVRRELKKHELLRYATLIVEYSESDYSSSREELRAKVRFSQLSSLSLSPASCTSAVASDRKDKPWCDVDFVRPAVCSQEPIKSERKDTVSNSVATRRRNGTEEKHSIYFKKEVGWEPKFPPQDTIAAAYDFHQIARFGNDDAYQSLPPNLNDKIAVFYADGNSFGKIQAESVDDESTQKHFDRIVQDGKNKTLKSVLEMASGSEKWNPLWWTSENQNQWLLRFETLLWGGDEVLWVYPAWFGLEVAKQFFIDAPRKPLNVDNQESENPDPRSKRTLDEHNFTYSAGLVFCHANAPIQQIKSLAMELGDAAKQLNDEPRNVLNYVCLESFDQLGDHVEAARRTQIPLPSKVDSAMVEQALAFHHLPAKEMGDLLSAIKWMKQNFPRGSAYKVLTNLREQGTSEEPLKKSCDSFRRTFNRGLRDVSPTSMQEAKDKGYFELFEVDNSTDCVQQRVNWVHLAELWDYLPTCLLYTSPSPRDQRGSRMPSSA